MIRRCDVVVVGGGPAGSAAAATLVRNGLTAALFERRAKSDVRAGETLSAEVGPLLRELGAWDALAPHLALEEPCPIVRSAWGSDEVDARPSILHPLGAGWHVDRAAFDLALVSWVRSIGVHVEADTLSCAVSIENGGFLVRPRRGEPAWAQRLVDASGRGAPATSALGGRAWLSIDRQVAIVARLEGASDVGSGLLLEAVREGYWYSVPLSEGALIAVLVTDADVLLSLGRDRSERFSRALAGSVHTAARAAGRTLAGRPRVFRSDSGRLVPDRGEGWIAVGDAATAADPLAGDGIARALRSGLDAPAAFETAFDDALAERRFGDYLDRRAAYYLIEARWSEAPFWARRRPLGPGGTPLSWREVEVTLPPDTMISWARAPGPSAEAWLPPVALGALQSMLARPRPAHELMRSLREAAPLGDRRLLVALEWLLAEGVLAAL